MSPPVLVIFYAKAIADKQMAVTNASGANAATIGQAVKPKAISGRRNTIGAPPPSTLHELINTFKSKVNENLWCKFLGSKCPNEEVDTDLNVMRHTYAKSDTSGYTTEGFFWRNSHSIFGAIQIFD